MGHKLPLWKKYDMIKQEQPGARLTVRTTTENGITKQLVGLVTNVGFIPLPKTFKMLTKSFFRSKEYREFKHRFLSEHPTCEFCGKPATLIHHIPPLSHLIMWEGKRFADMLTPDESCVPVCTECHYQTHFPQKEMKDHDHTLP